MALNIKDPETDRLARELAQATGENITEATRRAIQERLARVQARQAGARSRLDLQQVIERGRRARVVDVRTAEEIVGYDHSGLPS